MEEITGGGLTASTNGRRRSQPKPARRGGWLRGLFTTSQYASQYAGQDSGAQANPMSSGLWADLSGDADRRRLRIPPVPEPRPGHGRGICDCEFCRPEQHTPPPA
jgi:hypothetical protein